MTDVGTTMSPGDQNIFMRLTFVTFWAAVVLASGVPANAKTGQHQSASAAVNVVVDPRSSREAEAELLENGFHKWCPNVSIIRDASQAKYVILASESDPLRGFLLHYYITIYNAKGTVAFVTDKHHDKSATQAACKFINAQN
jgi:hypothetical protein